MTEIHPADYNPGGQPPPDGPTWDVDTLQDDYVVEGFALGYVVVVRKSDGQRGTLHFTHNPRVYYGFVEHHG